jgi:hypothetical protein
MLDSVLLSDGLLWSLLLLFWLLLLGSLLLKLNGIGRISENPTRELCKLFDFINVVLFNVLLIKGLKLELLLFTSLIFDVLLIKFRGEVE